MNVTVKKVLLITCMSVALTVLITYIGISIWIGLGVRSIAKSAMENNSLTRTMALMQMVESDHHSLKQKNRAVWALGQLGDPVALPLLKKYFKDEICDHDNQLCQHELEKAIKLLNEGVNITALLWRPLVAGNTDFEVKRK